jgi:Uma2 family endonuclease
VASVQQSRATLDDLYQTPEKAELIRGRIVTIMPTGRKPTRLGGRIYRSLDDYAASSKLAEAFPDNVGYAIAMLPSGRESFSPGPSYHSGPFPKNEMRFIVGAPQFAVEVRGENDYSAAAELEMAEKRTDYFLTGTQVVWDVDTLAECIHVYRVSNPDHLDTFRHGDIADAEPAVPGWRVSVDWMFS